MNTAMSQDEVAGGTSDAEDEQGTLVTLRDKIDLLCSSLSLRIDSNVDALMEVTQRVERLAELACGLLLGMFCLYVIALFVLIRTIMHFYANS